MCTWATLNNFLCELQIYSSLAHLFLNSKNFLSLPVFNWVLSIVKHTRCFYNVFLTSFVCLRRLKGISETSYIYYAELYDGKTFTLSKSLSGWVSIWIYICGALMWRIIQVHTWASLNIFHLYFSYLSKRKDVLEMYDVHTMYFLHYPFTNRILRVFITMKFRCGFSNDFLVRHIWIRTRTSTLLKDLLQLCKILVHVKCGLLIMFRCHKLVSLQLFCFSYWSVDFFIIISEIPLIMFLLFLSCHI